MDEKVICHCLDITEGQIINLVKAGHDTTDKIESQCGAGSVCGACTDDIQEIIDNN